MIYTPIGHDCFQGAGRRAKGTGVYVFFWEPESTMGYGKLIDFTASIGHSFCSAYHFHFSLLSFHFTFPSVFVLTLFDGCHDNDL